MASIEAIRVFEKSLQVAEQQVETIESRIEVGNLPQNEAALVRAEFAVRKQALIDAESLRRAQQLQLARLIYPSLSLNLIESIRLSSRPQGTSVEQPDIEDRIRLALQSRPEIKQAELLIARDELETVVTKNGLLPRLELFINLGKSGYADTFRDSFKELDSSSYDVTVGLEWTQALGKRAA